MAVSHIDWPTDSFVHFFQAATDAYSGYHIEWSVHQHEVNLTLRVSGYLKHGNGQTYCAYLDVDRSSIYLCPTQQAVRDFANSVRLQVRAKVLAYAEEAKFQQLMDYQDKLDELKVQSLKYTKNTVYLDVMAEKNSLDMLEMSFTDAGCGEGDEPTTHAPSFLSSAITDTQQAIAQEVSDALKQQYEGMFVPSKLPEVLVEPDEAFLKVNFTSEDLAELKAKIKAQMMPMLAADTVVPPAGSFFKSEEFTATLGASLKGAVLPTPAHQLGAAAAVGMMVGSLESPAVRNHYRLLVNDRVQHKGSGATYSLKDLILLWEQRQQGKLVTLEQVQEMTVKALPELPRTRVRLISLSDDEGE